MKLISLKTPEFFNSGVFCYVLSEPCVCINLRRVGRKVTGFYDKALEPVGIGVTQYSLLINICHIEGCGTGELAQRVKLEKSTLVRTLQPLLKAGLVVDKSSGEKRRRCLYLTPAGEDVLKRAYPLWMKAEEEVMLKLGMSYEEIVKFFERVDL